MQKRTSLAGLAALALTGVTGANDIKWDNNVVTDEWSGRALSPPAFPDIRVVDDISFAGATLIKGAHFSVIEDAGWLPGDVLEVTFYEDTGNGPGVLVEQRTGSYDRMATGRQIFSRDEYQYWIEFDTPFRVHANGGEFWVGLRNPNGSGAGTNYWLTSNGGPDGMDSSTGYFSLDGGQTWQPEGAGWHHAFELVPAPGVLALFAAGGLVPGRRRRAAG